MNTVVNLLYKGFLNSNKRFQLVQYEDGRAPHMRLSVGHGYYYGHIDTFNKNLYLKEDMPAGYSFIRVMHKSIKKGIV